MVFLNITIESRFRVTPRHLDASNRRNRPSPSRHRLRRL